MQSVTYKSKHKQTPVKTSRVQHRGSPDERPVVSTVSLHAQPATPQKARSPRSRQRRPALRVVPAVVEIEPVQLALDLEWEAAPGLPAIPVAPRHLHLVPSPGSVPASSHDEILAMPGANKWLARLVNAVFEVATGQRPAGQLTRYVAREQLVRITQRGQAVARHPSSRQRAGVTRLRAVRSIRLCPITEHVVEMSAVLIGGERAQAIGMRLERTGDTWVVTDIALP